MLAREIIPLGEGIYYVEARFSYARRITRTRTKDINRVSFVTNSGDILRHENWIKPKIAEDKLNAMMKVYKHISTSIPVYVILEYSDTKQQEHICYSLIDFSFTRPTTSELAPWLTSLKSHKLARAEK